MAPTTYQMWQEMHKHCRDLPLKGPPGSKSKKGHEQGGVIVSGGVGWERLHEEGSTKVGQLESIEGKGSHLQRNRSINIQEV